MGGRISTLLLCVYLKYLSLCATVNFNLTRGHIDKFSNAYINTSCESNCSRNACSPYFRASCIAPSCHSCHCNKRYPTFKYNKSSIGECVKNEIISYSSGKWYITHLYSSVHVMTCMHENMFSTELYASIISMR